MSGDRLPGESMSAMYERWADEAKAEARSLTGWRNRKARRAADLRARGAAIAMVYMMQAEGRTTMSKAERMELWR